MDGEPEADDDPSEGEAQTGKKWEAVSEEKVFALKLKSTKPW